jgi:membrane protein required for colicin V production
MWLDLVAISILLLFAGLGAWRGAFATGAGLASILVAYGCAVLLATPLAPMVAAATGVSDILALPFAGTLGFVVGYLAVSLIAAVLRRTTHLDGDDSSPRDRFLGATFGTVRGALIVLLVSLLANWVDALRVTGAESPIPSIERSRAAAVTSVVVEAGLGAALADEGPAGRVVARIAARPALALGELEGVFSSPGFMSVRDDAMFWTYLEHGNVDAALNRGSFNGITYDAPLRQHLADVGLVTQTAADDPREFRHAMAEVLRQVGPRIRQLKNDPELQALAEDPEVMALVQSGDTLALLQHPGFRKLVDRVTSELEPSESQPL